MAMSHQEVFCCLKIRLKLLNRGCLRAPLIQEIGFVEYAEHWLLVGIYESEINKKNINPYAAKLK